MKANTIFDGINSHYDVKRFDVALGQAPFTIQLEDANPECRWLFDEDQVLQIVPATDKQSARVTPLMKGKSSIFITSPRVVNNQIEVLLELAITVFDTGEAKNLGLTASEPVLK